MSSRARRLPLALALAGVSLVIATHLVAMFPDGGKRAQAGVTAAVRQADRRRVTTASVSGFQNEARFNATGSDGILSGQAGQHGMLEVQPLLPQPPPPAPPLPPQRCAIYNNVTWHFDVAAGAAWAFQEAGCNVTCYLHPDSFGIQDVMASWYRGGYRIPDRMQEDAPQYDVIVFITFPEPPATVEVQRQLLTQHAAAAAAPPNQRFLLVVHNPDDLLASAPGWVPDLLLEQVVQQQERSEGGKQEKKGAKGSGSGTGIVEGKGQVAARIAAAAAGGARRRLQAAGDRGGSRGGSGGGSRDTAKLPRPLPPPVQLLALSPIVSGYLRALVETWAAGKLPGGGGRQLAPRVEVPWLAPLVPWRPSFSGGSFIRHAGSGIFRGRHHLQHLCIQGNIDSRRRDYAAAFAAASHPAVVEQLRQRKEVLLVVGKSKGQQLAIPEPMKPFVRILADLPFQEYYDTLACCRAILTAFVTDSYMINKTSSTIATSIQVGVPLLTEQRVLVAYTYVQRDAAFAYKAPPGAFQPDPSALGAAAAAAAAIEAAQRSTAEAEAGARVASSRRLLGGQTGLDQPAAACGSPAIAQRGSAAGAAAAASRSLQQQERRWQRRRLAAETDREHEQQAAGEGKEASAESRQLGDKQHTQQRKQRDGDLPSGEEAGVEGGAGQPEAGSYSDALLQVFTRGASREAHGAARSLKADLMEHNADVARQFLRDTAARAAAVSR